MSDSVKAAAERLRNTCDSNLFYWRSSDCQRDQAILAYAYLAEHPADDSEPIDGCWLRGVGFTNKSDNIEQFIENEWFSGEHRIEIQPEDGDYLGEEMRIMIYSKPVWVCEVRNRSHGWDESIAVGGDLKTRGDVRRLAAALGIALKEGGGK
jgi:hypothetical protein